MNVLAALAGSLPGSFLPETLRRAAAYADGGRVSTPQLRELEADWCEALAHVRGTRPAPYVVVLRAWPDDAGGDGLEVETVCSCPVGLQCKHGAAVGLVLGGAFGRRPEPSWQDEAARLLDDLGDLAPPAEPLPGVGLQVSLGHAGRYQRLTDRPSLLLRPLRPGRRQPWAKTGLGWSEVARALVTRTHDVDQLQVLERLAAAQQVTGGYWYGPGTDLDLADLGRAAVGLLREARDAGITFVPVAPLRSVEIHDEQLPLVVDVRTADDGSSLLDVGVAHPDGLWSGAGLTPYGDPAHSVTWIQDGRVVLAELDRRVGGGALRALRRSGPVQVPAGAGAELTDVLRRIVTVAPVGSSDGTVQIPERARPRLRVTVSWEGAGAAEVRWECCYPGAAGSEVTVRIDDPTPLPGVRDRAAERRLLDAVDPRPEQGVARVEGVDVLHLALLELPTWRLVEGLDVVEHAAPDFREAEQPPEISFDAADDGAHDPGEVSTDWLDLWVSVTVEGEPVALPHLLAALTRGDDHVVLPSGLYVRLDRPELAALHEVVQAAAQLHERDPDDERLRVGRQDLGVWAQLADLGEVDDRAEEWVQRAQALRDLTELPRPEPRGLVTTLRDYQRDGFWWLAFLHQHALGGILADEMGLGKTLQVLALVAHARAEDPDAPPFLVVAPTSVVGAWASEAARHAPGLRVRTVAATAARRGSDIVDLAAGADVVVTTYTLLRLEAAQYAATAWSGLVLDEAQWIKNHQSKAYAAVRAIDAPFRLAVTGTPFENRLLELWSLLSIVTPGLYPQARTFVTHVVGPVEKGGDSAALRRFSRRIRPFVLRRTKDLVAAELPPKQEQVLAVQLSAGHRRIYDTHLAKERQRILGLVDDDFDRNRVAILAALTRMRQLALDPALVDPDHDHVGSAKIDLLVEQLREVAAEGHRALVFSQFTGFLSRVRDRLDREAIASTYLDGRTRHRAEVVEAFRTGDAPVFLISLKAGGVGLTLTEADYVFVLDPWWNPAAESQAVDRAHRIGQERAVMVYRLVSADTIEDKVMALKARKAALFAQVLDGETGLSDSITAADIRSLLD